MAWAGFFGLGAGFGLRRQDRIIIALERAWRYRLFLRFGFTPHV